MKCQGLNFKNLILFISAIFLFGCDDFTEDSKGPIGDKRATAEFLLKVPRLERKVFLVNTNGYGTSMGYDSGSLQIYSVNKENLNEPEQSLEIPSLASSVTVNDSHIFITYDAYGDNQASVMVIPYSISTVEQTIQLLDPVTFVLERFNEKDDAKTPKSSGATPAKKKKKLQPRYSLVNNKFFVTSCASGELFVMDLRKETLEAPKHVRSYGDKVQRSALIMTSDNNLLLFPGQSTSTGSDGIFDSEDTYSEKGEPKTINKNWNIEKMGVSPYKLVVFDLNKEWSYEPLTVSLEERETFWLSFDLKGTKSENEKKYYRTHFHKVNAAPEANTFYLMQKSSEEKKKLHRMLKVKIDVEALREESKDLAKALKFSEEPLFILKEGEVKYKVIDGNKSKEENLNINFALDSFSVIDEANKVALLLSYNFKSGYFAVVKTGGELPVLLQHTEQNNKAYKGLVRFDDSYVTVEDYYRFGAKLVLNQL